MPEYRIELRNVGRGKVNLDLLSTEPNIEAAEERALREGHKFLASRFVDIDDMGEGNYEITTGFRTVGHIRILEIEKGVPS